MVGLWGSEEELWPHDVMCSQRPCCSSETRTYRGHRHIHSNHVSLLSLDIHPSTSLLLSLRKSDSHKSGLSGSYAARYFIASSRCGVTFWFRYCLVGPPCATGLSGFVGGIEPGRVAGAGGVETEDAGAGWIVERCSIVGGWGGGCGSVGSGACWMLLRGV